jgi:hypothetical protein
MTYKPKLPIGDSIFSQNWGPTKKCAAAIEKIVTATGKEPDDRMALAKDLDGAHIVFASLHLQAEPVGGAKLKRIRKMAEKLATAINANSLAKEAAKGIVDLDRLCDELRRLEAAKSGRRPSLVEYLAGELLPAIYERRFSAKPTPTRNGVFLRFAAAALGALGVNCSPETVIKGLTRFRRA